MCRARVFNLVRNCVLQHRFAALFTLQVGDNGFISFRQGHLFSQPQLLPSANAAIRDALMVAPYWSNVDIRLQGRIYYRLIEAGRTTEELDIALLNFVSGFIAARQSSSAANFSATTMLVAQWRDVPPFPSGAGDIEGLSENDAELINQVQTELELCFSFFVSVCPSK